MTLSYLAGGSREDEARRYCERCDLYRGHICAEHRAPSYGAIAAELTRLRRSHVALLAACEVVWDLLCDYEIGDTPAGRQLLAAIARAKE